MLLPIYIHLIIINNSYFCVCACVCERLCVCVSAKQLNKISHWWLRGWDVRCVCRSPVSVFECDMIRSTLMTLWSNMTVRHMSAFPQLVQTPASPHAPAWLACMYVTSCDIMWHHVISCDIMWNHVLGKAGRRSQNTGYLCVQTIVRLCV